MTGTGGSVRQRVQVSPGATTTVMVPLPRRAPPQSTGGWLSITAPTELQVFEGDRLLGTTRVNPLMLPTGTHTLRLSSESAGVDLTRRGVHRAWQDRPTAGHRAAGHAEHQRGSLGGRVDRRA